MHSVNAPLLSVNGQRLADANAPYKFSINKAVASENSPPSCREWKFIPAITLERRKHAL